MKNQKKTYYRAGNKKFIGGEIEIDKHDFFSHPTGKWFETMDEAVNNFLAVQERAKVKAEEIVTEYQKLQQKLGFSVGFIYEGDTYGIYDEYQYISFKFDGYMFMVKDE